MIYFQMQFTAVRWRFMIKALKKHQFETQMWTVSVLFILRKSWQITSLIVTSVPFANWWTIEKQLLVSLEIIKNQALPIFPVLFSELWESGRINVWLNGRKRSLNTKCCACPQQNLWISNIHSFILSSLLVVCLLCVTYYDGLWSKMGEI